MKRLVLNFTKPQKWTEYDVVVDARIFVRADILRPSFLPRMVRISNIGIRTQISRIELEILLPLGFFCRGILKEKSQKLINNGKCSVRHISRNFHVINICIRFAIQKQLVIYWRVGYFSVAFFDVCFVCKQSIYA